ncbi:alpha/beta fold hydrolase [Pseudomonas marginalis]|uniref:Alpha/beta hydrolase n=1 Tax=Pseudomonas marginalis TaxID=298 RepID=A0A9X9BQ22_PSEMA|nr:MULTISPECIES: alpha/beta fold hydrolase [Pseudomonas]MDT9632018.1 alpha/beta hydrolase [Pseudomonas sp. JV449]TKJ73288.1 hypothetical protein PspCFBP13509_28505 [Pseudomonas sp. CFBP13509]TWR55633.1 alpha/beta hydrolase [Pseudomonas marginalis]
MGGGPPILLIPGWPQSWYAGRYVMPQLVDAAYRVIAVDPRGMGKVMHPYARSSFHVTEPQMRPAGDRLCDCTNACL